MKKLTVFPWLFIKMTIVWFSASFLLVLYSVDVHAEIKLPSFGNLTYVQQGSDIILPWTFTFDMNKLALRQWRFFKIGETTSTTLAFIVADGTPTIFNYTFTGISVRKPATLILKNASVDHSGTYRLQIQLNAATNPPSDIMVIIPVRPTIEANCSGTITLKEGENLYCLCNGSDNPPATAFWSKDGQPYGKRGDLMQPLVLRNVDRSGPGTYKCTVRRYNLEDSTSFTLEVEYKPIIYPLDKIAILGEPLTISWKSDGVPEPEYVIFHNNTKVKDGKEYTINKVEFIHAGLYTCKATNFLGSDSKSFSLTVKVPTTYTTPPSVEITTKEREKIISDKSCNCGTDWYLFLIASICGVIVGMVLLYAIMWLRLRLSKNKKRDHSIPSQQQAAKDEHSGEGLESGSAYQELDLQNMNKGDDNYQSLEMTSRNAQSNTAPVEIESEAGYQELNEIRGNTDDNYQPLNRV